MKHGNILKAKGWTVVIASVAILFFGLQPCGADTPKYGGHLRFAYGLEASSLDPHLGTAITGSRCLIFWWEPIHP
jgi:hypothetical protein